MSTTDEQTSDVSASTAMPPTVFVVDDDAEMRKSLTWLIESVKLPVETYESATAFLAQFDPDRPGCVVCDVRMPGMSGLELQQRLHAIRSAIPMIFVTAYGEVPTAVEAMKGGAVDFLGKPVSDQVLLDHVQRAVERDVAAKSGQAEVAAIDERIKRLTRRELEVLSLVVEGLSSKSIATRIGVSFKTVEAHRAKIMRKTQAPNVPHLIRMVLQYGRLPAGLGKPGRVRGDVGSE